MNISVNLDAVVLQALIKRYPQATADSINVFKDTVGYYLEGQSKKAAPAITGNLRRQIFYGGVTRGAVLYSYAEYSKYVHGAPYYKNKGRRRETKFFSNTIKTSNSFIKKEAENIFKRVLQ